MFKKIFAALLVLFCFQDILVPDSFRYPRTDESGYEKYYLPVNLGLSQIAVVHTTDRNCTICCISRN